jgi:hypothetical protein
MPEVELDEFEQLVENLRARGWATYRCPPRHVMLYNRRSFDRLKFQDEPGPRTDT